jgi:hypothetical protein
VTGAFVPFENPEMRCLNVGVYLLDLSAEQAKEHGALAAMHQEMAKAADEEVTIGPVRPTVQESDGRWRYRRQPNLDSYP